MTWISTLLSDKALRWSLGLFLIARVSLTVWSLLVAFLLPIQVQNLDLFNVPVLATFDIKTSERHTFSRQVDGNVLLFRPGEPGFVVDTQTSSVWSLKDGRAITGPLVGSSLNASVYSVEDVFPYHGVAVENNPVLALWQRFDANWYVAIAERGYGSVEGDTHFPPLYPLLIRLLGVLLANYFVSGLIVSNLATVAMLVVFYRITSESLGTSIAQRATVYLLIFPTAFFFFSAYTESLFLLAAFLALWSMQKREWLWAGFWTFCAILIRLQGIALIAPLGYVLWTTRPVDKRLARAIALALSGGAVALYLFIRAVSGGSAVLPATEPSLFARLAPPWENYVYALQTLASGHFTFADALNLVITTLFGAVLVINWRRLPLTFSLYTAASLIVLTMRVVETQPLNSMSRYSLTLFPVFILLAGSGRNAWVNRVVVYTSVPLQLFLSAQFVMWGWVG